MNNTSKMKNKMVDVSGVMIKYVGNDYWFGYGKLSDF